MRSPPEAGATGVFCSSGQREPASCPKLSFYPGSVFQIIGDRALFLFGLQAKAMISSRSLLRPVLYPWNVFGRERFLS